MKLYVRQLYHNVGCSSFKTASLGLAALKTLLRVEADEFFCVSLSANLVPGTKVLWVFHFR